MSYRACLFSTALVAAAVALTGTPVRAQPTAPTVADGIFTDAQAARGATVYEAACAGCHRADLGGATGPALRDERFARQFAGKDLKTLFTKAATTMPRGAPGTLGDNVYLDVVAHVLKENGFPSGGRELTVDGLEGVLVIAGRPKPPPSVGDFSYVDVVGCLVPGAQHTWMLTQASAPVVAVPAASGSRDAAQPLGRQTFRLLDAMAYAPGAHAQQKVHVRGLLIRLPDEQRITISSLDALSPACRE
jgi:cytochrome c5